MDDFKTLPTAPDYLYDHTELLDKYSNLLDKVRDIVKANGCCMVCECLRCDLVKVLKDIGEWKYEV